AQHDAPAERHVANDRLEQRAADVLEVDVHALGGQLGEALAHVFVLVVNRTVQPELVDEPAALHRPAGDAYRSAAVNLRNLRGDRTRGARRPRGENRLAFLDLANVEHAEIRRQSGSAEHAHVAGKWKGGRQ